MSTYTAISAGRFSGYLNGSTLNLFNGDIYKENHYLIFLQV